MKSPSADRCKPTCEHCGALLHRSDSRTRFCSRSCAARANRNRLGTGRPPLPCKRCGTLLAERSQRNSVFCSRACARDFRYEQQVAAWLGDPSGRDWSRRLDGRPLSSIQLPAFIRRWLIEEHGSTACWRCGFDEENPFTQLSVVQVNHRDGNPLNNTPANLERLCPNCHSLSEFHGRRGRGRPARYDRR